MRLYITEAHIFLHNFFVQKNMLRFVKNTKIFATFEFLNLLLRGQDPAAMFSDRFKYN